MFSYALMATIFITLLLSNILQLVNVRPLGLEPRTPTLSSGLRTRTDVSTYVPKYQFDSTGKL